MFTVGLGVEQHPRFIEGLQFSLSSLCFTYKFIASVKLVAFHWE